jgi:transcriptional regulator with XRE-family HTH domain
MATAKRPRKKQADRSPRPRASGDGDKEMGQRIRLRRTEMQLSQSELGTKLGVSFQQVQKYEKGVNRVSGTRLVQIARAIDTTPNFLLGWGDKSTHTQLDVGVWKIALEMKDLAPDDVIVARTLVRALLDRRATGK